MSSPWRQAWSSLTTNERELYEWGKGITDFEENKRLYPNAITNFLAIIKRYPALVHDDNQSRTSSLSQWSQLPSNDGDIPIAAWQKQYHKDRNRAYVEDDGTITPRIKAVNTFAQRNYQNKSNPSSSSLPPPPPFPPLSPVPPVPPLAYQERSPPANRRTDILARIQTISAENEEFAHQMAKNDHELTNLEMELLSLTGPQLEQAGRQAVDGQSLQQGRRRRRNKGKQVDAQSTYDPDEPL